VKARLIQPPIGVGRGDQIEEPTQESDAVRAAKTEPEGICRQAVGERSRVIEVPADRVCNDLGDSLGVFVVGKKV
jgi:hypothetical protein